MSVRTQFFERHGLIVEQLEGELTLDAAQRMKRAEAELLPRSSRPRILCLVGSVTYRLELVREFSRWMLSQEHRGPEPQVACVVREPMGAALMLMLRQHLRTSQMEIFSTLDAALPWLGLDPAQLTPDALGIDLVRSNGVWRTRRDASPHEGDRLLH